jgi:hypothetical protein
MGTAAPFGEAPRAPVEGESPRGEWLRGCSQQAGPPSCPAQVVTSILHPLVS